MYIQQFYVNLVSIWCQEKKKNILLIIEDKDMLRISNE